MAHADSGNIGYALNLFSLPPGFNPADNTTYHIAHGSSSIEGFRTFIPKSGVIKKCYITMISSSVALGGQVSTISIRLNSTTDILISNSVANNPSVVTVSNTSLNTIVSEGDFVALKWETPAWTVNPTVVLVFSTIYIE